MDKKINKYKGPVKDKLKAIELLLNDNKAIDSMVGFIADATGINKNQLSNIESQTLTGYVRSMLEAARC
jgi:hypothetical protein